MSVVPDGNGLSGKAGGTRGHPLPVAVLIGSGYALSFHPRGGLTITHAVLAIGALVFLPTAWSLRATRWLFGLVALWMVGILGTSLIAQDSIFNMCLALSYPLTILLSYYGAVWAMRQRAPVPAAFVATLITGLIAATFLYRVGHYEADPWKYGVGAIVTMGCILFAALLFRRGMPTLAVLTASAICLANLMLGFRSLFLVTAVAVIASVLTALTGTGGTRWIRCFLVGGALSLTLVGLYSLYGQLASEGTLGREQQVKWFRQSDSEGGAVIGARPEIAGSVALVSESPLVGLGVKPQVGLETRSVFFKNWRVTNGGVEGSHERYVYFGQGLLVHSILFQRWLESGILVLPGLLAPIALVVAALIAAIRNADRASTLIFCFIACLLLWDLFFSPWSRLEGVYLGSSAAAAAVYLRSRERKPSLGKPADADARSGSAPARMQYGLRAG